MTTHYQKREVLRLVRSGHTRRLRPLLENEVDVNFLNRKTGMTPLMRAAYAGRTEAVSLLLEFNADPNLRADDNASALFWACICGDVEIVNMLIDAEADLNVRRVSDRLDDGPAPIHAAIRKNTTPERNKVAMKLVDAGASIDIEYFGRTVLEYAQWHQCDVIVDYLRQRGVRR